MPDDRSSRPPLSDKEAAAEEERIGWRMAGLGFTVASEVAAGTLLGYLADYLFGTTPVWTTVGAVLGITVSLWGLIRGAYRMNRLMDEQTARRKRTSTGAEESRTTPGADGDDPDEGTSDQIDSGD